MARTVDDEVLELARPALEKRVGDLVEAAFKLAQFAGCSDALERAIDVCSRKYFGEEPSAPDSPQDEMPQMPSDRVARNLVTGGQIRKMQAPKRHKRRPTHASYAPGKLVKAARYSPDGRPQSQYTGVVYSGSINKPWLVRYLGKRIGVYRDEEEAAAVYDSLLMRDGKQPRNFAQG